MKKFLLGRLHGTKQPFYFPRSALDTHLHLIGGTGKGKTTALHTILHALMLDPVGRPCIVIIDRLGGLSFDLLSWIASDFCTEEVRERLIYVEPAREDIVFGFNPLLYDTEGHAYYKVSRAAEIVLRGWASQNLEEMPRLARWLFNSFFAGALLGLTIADTQHLLLPGSPFHRPILRCLPPRLKGEWVEILASHSAEVSRILESARNRLKPYQEAPVLRQMLGATHNRLDTLRFMQEGRILLINLAPGNRLPEQAADAIGGLIINEILATVRSQPLGVRLPVYLFLDEFQRFVSQDLQSALPELRQARTRLILSHQSLSQLKRGDIDLTNLIFQCQSRFVFGLQGEDADILAHEHASLEFDPDRIKQELYSHRQRLVGHRLEVLGSWSEGTTDMESWMRQFGQGWGTAQTIQPGRRASTVIDSTNRSHQQNEGAGGSRGRTSSHGSHEQLVPVHEDFLELARREFVKFEEDERVWGRKIRIANRGRAFVRLVDQAELFDVDIKRSAPGHLSWDAEQLARNYPEAFDDVQKLIERNFQQDCFVSPQVIEQETRERLDRVLRLSQTIDLTPRTPPSDQAPAPRDNPFP